MTRTLSIILCLALAACADVTSEVGETFDALRDGDGTFSDAGREAKDIVDQVGDGLDRDGKLELERELDMQLDEIEDALNALGQKAKLHPSPESDRRLEDLRLLAEDVRRDLETVPDAASAAWRDAAQAVKNGVEELRRGAEELDRDLDRSE